MELASYFQIRFTQNKLKAMIHLKKEVPEEITVTIEDIIHFLKSHSITYGINEEQANRIATNPNYIEYPIVVAIGKEPINGEDAYMEWIAPGLKETMEKKELTDSDWIDYRNILKIPMAKKGEIICKKINATIGIPGVNVEGSEVVPRPGKDFKIRQGKNTILNEETNEIIAEVPGQIGVQKNNVSINPVFEVREDLSLKTGNIDFIGHVHIFGNVPSGYTVTAGGDIIVEGIVEASQLEAGGTIFVKNGIIGAQRGHIKAKGNIQTQYINQGIIEAGGDVIVEQMIMHSQVATFGQVICNGKRAEIVGGSVSSQKKIMARTIGNDSHTKTKIYLGPNEKAVRQLKDIKEKLQMIHETNQKIISIEQKLNEKKELMPLTPKERVMLLRVKNTKLQNDKELIRLTEDKIELEEVFEKAKSAQLEVTGQAFPNVEIIFGKYHKQLQRTFDHIKVNVEDGEITISPL